MIIIYNKNIDNLIYFPKNIYKNDQTSYKLTLINRATNVSYNFDDIEDKKLVPLDYYTFILNFSKLPEDEYEYSISSESFIFSKGIIKLKDSNKEIKYYNKNREYIVYEGK